MKIVAFLLLLVACTMVWQHVRYLRARRDMVQDQQAILYSSSNFHVVTFLETAEGADLIEQVAELRRAMEASGTAKLVYAGQAAFTVESTQLGPRSWDAVVLVQYPSRESYEDAAKSVAQRDALAAFAQTYSHGMERHPVANLLLPQVLLVIRFIDIIRGNWNVEDLDPMPAPETSERMAFLEDRRADLLGLQSVNAEAVLVFNLMQAGDPEQRAANRSYGFKMMSRMAALAHGPMHMGTAVTLEAEARFDDVAAVYYPGVAYFSELLGSGFFQGIVGDKQLGDTMVVATVPILSRL